MTINGSDIQHMCYAGSALQDACIIMYNDGSEGEGESEWERKGSWVAIKMHEASRLMQPCNLTVTQQLCNHTLERGRLKCVYAWLFARVSVHALCEWGYVFVHIPAGRLVPIQWFVIMSTHNSTHMSKSMPKSQRWFNFGCLSTSRLFFLHRNTVASHWLLYLSLCLWCHTAFFFSRCMVFLFIGSHKWEQIGQVEVGQAWFKLWIRVWSWCLRQWATMMCQQQSTSL